MNFFFSAHRKEKKDWNNAEMRVLRFLFASDVLENLMNFDQKQKKDEKR